MRRWFLVLAILLLLAGLALATAAYAREIEGMGSAFLTWPRGLYYRRPPWEVEPRGRPPGVGWLRRATISLADDLSTSSGLHAFYPEMETGFRLAVGKVACDNRDAFLKRALGGEGR